MTQHTFPCIDGHTCGNPVRLVTGGAPLLKGANMLEKRAHFLAEYDWIRTGLMFEPRGHDQMSGAILYPPTREDCDIAVLFIETSGCLPMCGHGTIGTVTMALENGLVTPATPGQLRLETPAGRVDVTYRQEGRFVEEARLTNVPAFLHSEGLTAEVDGLGEVVVDVAYGGNFYAIVEPQKNFRDLADFSVSELVGLSPKLRAALNAKYEFIHPEHPAINGLSHILWTGDAQAPEAHARNAVFYGDKAIDRSPCGTGTSARMAQLAAKGNLEVGDDFVHESIIGSMFKGRVEAAAEVAGKPAIIPSIAGWARVTGFNTIFIDERDPFAHGFVVT
ncbi:putative 4-hydroxyproline 2-epimerase (plasmid) [Sulfitobacter sp. DSM 110093]|uniref:4-hydroxyproline epimerase n=1 Tax=Sulfitobacter sp. DSM 110093 TaxID=2883127 RepID=UPI001FAC83CC|nr:4-hydroxyproline epimerase [Sulfitobacter sp. DSM 110093]UOA34233.1 putative 4-hydroxyproline 2-epimerase [Sulfitobacter sp. DSM 110093]